MFASLARLPGARGWGREGPRRTRGWGDPKVERERGSWGVGREGAAGCTWPVCAGKEAGVSGTEEARPPRSPGARRVSRESLRSFRPFAKNDDHLLLSFKQQVELIRFAFWKDYCRRPCGGVRWLWTRCQRLKVTRPGRDEGGVKGESSGFWLGSGIETRGGNRLVNENWEDTIKMGIYLAVELLRHVVLMCLTYLGTARLFFKLAAPFYILTDSVRVFRSPHTLANTCFLCAL